MEPNLVLLVDCCRHAIDGAGEARLGDALRQANGRRLAALAARHRVEPLVWRAIRHFGIMLPGSEPIGAEARRAAADGLAMAVESGRLNRGLAQASIPHLFLKGQPLGRLAWDDAFAKRQIDIDLLVTPEAIGRTAAVLDALGYVQELPEPSVDPVDWHRRRKESSWRNDDGIIVDLHSRLADNPALLPQVTATSPAQQVEVVSGVVLPTLSDRLMLLHLAVHGSASSWFRLKWLADFAALIARTDRSLLADLADRAPLLGAGRTLSVALALAHRLFGTLVPDDLWFDSGAKRLMRLSRAALSDPREPTARPLGTLPLHLAQLLLVPGRAFATRELLRQAIATLTR